MSNRIAAEVSMRFGNEIHNQLPMNELDRLERDSDGATTDEAPPVVESRDLFEENCRRVIIRHGEREHVLVHTKRGKLVLNLR